jgi:hypothetical protein
VTGFRGQGRGRTADLAIFSSPTLCAVLTCENAGHTRANRRSYPLAVEASNDAVRQGRGVVDRTAGTVQGVWARYPVRLTAPPPGSSVGCCVAAKHCAVQARSHQAFAAALADADPPVCRCGRGPREPARPWSTAAGVSARHLCDTAGKWGFTDGLRTLLLPAPGAYRASRPLPALDRGPSRRGPHCRVLVADMGRTRWSSLKRPSPGACAARAPGGLTLAW